MFSRNCPKYVDRIGQRKYMGINGMSEHEHNTHTITYEYYEKENEKKEEKSVCSFVCLFVCAVNKIGNMFILWEV